MATAVALASAAAGFDPFSASIEENINHPEISNKALAPVAAAMTPLKNNLARAGFTTSTERHGTVVVATIPAAELFAPNQTDFTSKGTQKLSKLKAFVTNNHDYKVLIAVHADNTGDQMYAEQLTADRANAIDDFLAEGNDAEVEIIPYGLGNDEPVATNSTIAGRSKNRRVEIYFVPKQSFIDTHKRNRTN